MQKHFGNMISWFSFFITITTIYLIQSNIIEQKYIFLAVVIAAIMDMFDGKVARKFVTDEKDFIFGEITDSLCDTINFGVVTIYTFGLYFGDDLVLTILVSIFYLWAVVFRLARFSKTKDVPKVKYYEGVPVTVAGPIAVGMAVIFSNNISLVALTYVLLALAMISTIKVKKL